MGLMLVCGRNAEQIVNTKTKPGSTCTGVAGAETFTYERLGLIVADVTVHGTRLIYLGAAWLDSD